MNKILKKLGVALLIAIGFVNLVLATSYNFGAQDFGGATLSNAIWGGTAIEGTALASTGEVGGTKFLREDGDGSSSWQEVPAGAGGALAYIYQQSMIGQVEIDQFPTNSDDEDVVLFQTTFLDNIYVYDTSPGGEFQTRAMVTDQAGVTRGLGMVKIGAFLYSAGNDASTNAYLIRYTANDMAAGGTVMTVSGDALTGTTTTITRMISDGTSIWFNNDGGDTASSNHVWKKYTISGTTITSSTSTTCGSTSADFTHAAMDSSGNFYGMDGSFEAKRFNTSGTLQATTTQPLFTGVTMGATIEGRVYATGFDVSGEFASRMRLPLQP